MLPVCSRPILLLFALFCAACTERVVDSRAYNEEGKIVWSAVMPSSRNTALWLRYSVTAPVARGSNEDEGVVSYDLTGHLSVLADGGQFYNGTVFLKPEGIAVDRVYSDGERDGVDRNCGYSSCLETGRLMLLSMHEVPVGARLEFDGWLPVSHMGAELYSASLELAPH